AKRNDANNGLTLTITPQIRDEKGNIVDGKPQTVEVNDGLKGDPGATGAQGPKGDKGDQGERGLQGAPGLNGKTFAPVLTKDKDGVTTIKFYPVNPETGKADTEQPAVAEGAVKDGANGKSAYTT
ncbi:collagen-like protein, partial [Streptococcus anginosus]|uniref:collagen-like triple helix repeat-containing protein n=1 Tax=Streptococcus anginosus TaxID=1328 RepID=UPI0021F8AED6